MRLLPLLVMLAAVAPSPALPPSPHLRVTEFGQGRPIVVVPDLALPRERWLPTARLLAARHRVVLVDLPGQGGSALPEPFSLEAAARTLDTLLARERDAIVVGKGMGGLVAWLAARAHPERVAALVLVDVAVRSPLAANEAQLASFLDWMDEHYDEFLTLTHGSFGRDSAQNAQLLAAARATPAATIRAYLRAAMRADAARGLRAAPVPTTFVATDRFLGGESWTAVAPRFGWEQPGMVSLRRVAGSAYLVMEEQPDSLAAIVASVAATAKSSAR